eukprot:TRINITY_DN4745_c0_g1_i1.p1 TRINITY_DN4745_c0_g1~~TRINITY_DN4745_c0_g1_i1.p1  ORF type:complete len:821 (-),score=187.70 TRINITY_DN4745_c0_g1_i1:52-2514(-)
MDCTLSLISAAPNCLSNVLAWGNNNLVCYGASQMLLIYDPTKGKVIDFLKGHKDRVNVVRFLDTKDEDEIVSGATDKNIILWRRNKENGKYVQQEVLSGHTDSVTCLSSLPVDSPLILVSASIDKTVRIWHRQTIHSNFTLTQTITLSPKMAVSLAITLLPSNTPLLSIGNVDSKVHLYLPKTTENTDEKSTPVFAKLLMLEGHQDWVCSMSFSRIENDILFLATSSQDGKIRIWRISPLSPNSDTNISSLSSNSQSTSLSSKGHIFRVGTAKFSILLETVLYSHTDWVRSVQWKPPVITKSDSGVQIHQPMCVLSSSMDKTMIIWEFDTANNIWVDGARVGTLGGNNLGFYGGVFSPDGNQILGHDYTGSLHLWTKKDNLWVPTITVGGHFGPVNDLSWNSNSTFVISVSQDRTARVFAPWVKEEGEKDPTWFEIARPQIHGYELNCLAVIGNNDRIVTGADEKILRVFDAPQTFEDSLSNISKVQVKAGEFERPVAASQPVLGLSNKPFFSGNDNTTKESDHNNNLPIVDDEEGGGAGGDFEERVFQPVTLTQPPFEEHLQQSTLWPEIHKLYGHGNEVIAVCSNNEGTLIASASRGTTPVTSSIILWDAKNLTPIHPFLSAHTLSVVQMKFSPDDKYLLSVSRDRNWCLFQKTVIKSEDDSKKSDLITYTLFKKVSGGERILWSCDWSYDSKVFATGSRDKLVKIWGYDPDWNCIATLPPFASAVTAVEFAPPIYTERYQSYLLAVGEEDGTISFYSSPVKEMNWKCLLTLNSTLNHVATVSRIRWRTVRGDEKDKLVFKIATSSYDHSVRKYTIKI